MIDCNEPFGDAVQDGLKLAFLSLHLVKQFGIVQGKPGLAGNGFCQPQIFISEVIRLRVFERHDALLAHPFRQ